MTTMSGLTRAELCIASAVLPQVDEGTGLYAAHGNAVHDFLDLIAKGATREQALAKVVIDHRRACAAIDLDKVPHSSANWSSELKMAYDWESMRGRFITAPGHRQYGELGPTEIAGTADLVGVDDDTVIIIDVKTGYRWLGEPQDALQLLGYAVTVASALDLVKARVGFLYAREDEEPVLIMADISTEDLSAAADRIGDLMRTVDFARAMGKAEPHLGDHCTYCPAQRACPAKKMLWDAYVSNHMDKVAAALGGVDVDGHTVIPIEGAYRALELIGVVERMADTFKKQVKDMVRAHGPVHLEKEKPGFVLAEVECNVETLDGEKARPVLAELFGQDLADKAVKTKVYVTKGDIDDLVHQRAEVTKEKIGELNETVLEAIRAAGGSKVSTYLDVKTVKIAKKKKK